MSDSERRAAETQALFRLINEKMHDLNVALATITDDAEVVCECVDLNCIVQITMSPAAYEELRGHTTRFVVVSGHADPAFNMVLANHDGYELVRSIGAGELLTA